MIAVPAEPCGTLLRVLPFFLDVAHAEVDERGVIVGFEPVLLCVHQKLGVVFAVFFGVLAVKFLVPLFAGHGDMFVPARTVPVGARTFGDVPRITVFIT